MRFLLVLAAAASAGCTSRPASLTPGHVAAIEDSVRSFAATVASDINREGPAAWRRHFDTTSAFFMASEGQVVFPNSDAATPVIQDLARLVKQVELTWGDGLRVDPLAPGLAVVAAPYHEVRVDSLGERVDESGYMTGVVEDRAGRWRFRDLHWSVTSPPPGVR